MTYTKQLQDPRWQKKRLEVLERDDWRCKKCGDKKTELQVHHIKYHKKAWDTPLKHLDTLCAHCHVCVEGIKKLDKKYDLKFDYNALKIVKVAYDTKRVMFIFVFDKVFMETYRGYDEIIEGFCFHHPVCYKLSELLSHVPKGLKKPKSMLRSKPSQEDTLPF